MMTFCAAIAWANSVPGRLTSIMKKLVSLGMYLMFFFSRKAKVFSRTRLLMARRSATRPLDFEAGGGAGQTGDGHETDAEGTQLRQQVRTAHGEAGAQACHAVDLGEGAQHDHVLVGGDQIVARLARFRRSGCTLRRRPRWRPSSYWPAGTRYPYAGSRCRMDCWDCRRSRRRASGSALIMASTSWLKSSRSGTRVVLEPMNSGAPPP